MTPSRRLLFTAVAFLGAAACAQAQTAYPAKPIRLIVPLAAGSAVDNAARVLMQKMGQNMGQAFVIENQPGSAGLIGADRVAKAAPDGYTLGGFNDSVLTMVPHIYPTVTWNALTDFEPVSLVATIEWGIAVKEDSPLRSVGDLIRAARANPGKLNFASGGNGSPQHLSMALLASRANIVMTHVPYKGATPAAVAAAAGEVDVTFQGLGTVTSLVQAGKLRLLAVSSPKRLPQFPNVPTVAESTELPDFYFNSWFALVAPAKTPKDIVDQLYAQVKTAMDDPDTRAKIIAGGATPRTMPPAEFGKAIGEQFRMYRKLISDNNIKAE